MTRAGKPSGREASRRHRRRLRFLGLGWIVVALGLGWRGADLQLLETERWRAQAEAQNATRVEIPAERGSIYDRNGRPLALESSRFRVYLAPAETVDPEAAAAALGRILGLSRDEERRLAASEEGWTAVSRRITGSERDRLQAAVRRGLHFERLTERVHPQGDIGRSLLGSVLPVGEGRSGMELSLDSLLRGEAGTAMSRRDARGGLHVLPGAELSRPRPGNDVLLTLDAGLQKLAGSALERALRTTGASGGDLLMADPRTGEILALASDRPDGVLRVPALTDPYEPGSTLKPILLASLLAENRATLTEEVATEDGLYRLGQRVIRDVHPTDTLTVAEIVQHSSNIGAAKLAARLTPGEQYRYLRDFGFGVPTGVEYPTEAAGKLRRPENWSGFSQASLAMGYEISVTSLQLVAAYGALANGGVLMRPQLVREVRAPDGGVLFRQEPEPIRRVVDADLATRVTRVLGEVVEGGTASQAALATLAVAGKTGTARVAATAGYEEGRYAASFVGYTPAKDPRLVILAKLDDPQGEFYGGETAAPVSRATLQAALAAHELAPVGGESALTDPGGPLRWGLPPEPTRDEGPFIFTADAAPARWPMGARAPARQGRVLPDLTGLPVRTAVARLHELGMRAEVSATGRVEEQEPPAGREVEAGFPVRLR